MADVMFEIGGLRVDPRTLEDEMERALLEGIARDIGHKLASVACGIHSCTPEVMVRGRDVHHLTFNVRGCCPSLVNAAMDKLNEPDPDAWWQRDSIPDEPWKDC